MNRQGSLNKEIARNRALTDKPLVVLVNEGSFEKTPPPP
ncbi:hypothetical protein MC7420_5055 [Coleofasciculus chthonoplastes PCC 7420]|uniref:Uncharacterized protein n=1 Tax=Coleofasciculus chthonoplastes PCC 7420 TaxID=118168 RepID=B4W1C9_9CYAN|nr:hypothetical protein MC7420_5055 [Coleofasciculus chthonoplastes PCC 7420]